MNKRAKNRVVIFDTTLRDGEQAPGCSMTLREKLRVASALRDLRVDVIEAGFAAASPGDFDSVKAIAEEIEGPVICSLARCHPGDIERACKAVEPAKRKRIHVFVATSEIHRKYKLEMAKDEIISRAVKAVQMAREACDDVEFSPEDASRTEPAYLADVVAAVIEAGAGTINIPDTVGYTVPLEFAELFGYLKQNVAGIDDAVLSVHCHDDLGMAVANSLAAVTAGARQIECTINGIGERAGNCSLEEVVMALHTRAEYFGTTTDVGRSKSNLVLGKHSGRHAFRERVEQLGFSPNDTELNRAFEDFKKLADRKKELFDADIEAIIMNTEGVQHGPWTMDELHFASGTGAIATGSVRLTHADGRTIDEAATGDGPVEAAFKALERATGVVLELQNFEVHSVTMGEDAQGEVTVTVEYNGHSYRGNGISTDIVEAGARAYLEVINRICRRAASSDAADDKPAGRVATI